MEEIVALELDQGRNPSLLRVVEVGERGAGSGRSAHHFVVRLLKRLPVGSSFQESARWELPNTTRPAQLGARLP